MRMLEMKSQTHFLTHHACRRFSFNDAEVEWIDIIFENPNGVATCAPHAHDWFEFNYVAKGRMETAFEDGLMRSLDVGTFVLIPPGTVHSHRYDTVNPHEGLCLRWRLNRKPGAAEATEARSDEISVYDKLTRLSESAPEALQDDFGLGDRLERMLAESEAGEQAIIVQLSFVRFVMRLAEAVASSVPAATPPANTDRLTRKVDIFLNDLQDRELDVRKLAASLHLSYAHVAREFKRRTGRTIIERMTEIRLYRAVELLQRSDLPMREVAERAGFASAYYFSRVFKRQFGVSPSLYRSERSGKADSRTGDG